MPCNNSLTYILYYDKIVLKRYAIVSNQFEKLKIPPIALLLIRMFTNFGRDVVSSDDLFYNEAIEKPLSEREVARVSVTEGACVTLSLC